MESHFDFRLHTLYATFEVWPLNAPELEKTERSRSSRRVNLHKGKLVFQLPNCYKKASVSKSKKNLHAMFQSILLILNS